MEASSLPAPGAPALRPLSIGELLDVAIKIYRRHAKQLLKIVVYVVLPVHVLAIIVSVMTVPEGTTTVRQFGVTTTTTTTTDAGGYVAAQLITGVLSAIATLIATAASVKAVSDAWMGVTPYWRESLRAAVRRAGALVWLVILAGALLLASAVAFFIPAIWLSVPCALAFPVLMVEDRRGFKAIRRGIELVRKRWWGTAAAIFLGYLLASIITFILAFVLAAVLVASNDSATSFAIANGIAGAAASVLTTPFTAAIITLAYYDLRVRKEGLDLELLARRFGLPADAAREPFFTPTGRYAGPEPPFWPPPPDWQPPPGWTPSPPSQS